MVSRQDQIFVKLNWFRSDEPLILFIYLFIYLFYFVSNHIVIVTHCNMQIKQIIIKVRWAGRHKICRERETKINNNRFFHTLIWKTDGSSTSDRNFMSFHEWSTAERVERHNKFLSRVEDPAMFHCFHWSIPHLHIRYYSALVRDCEI